MMEMTSLRQLHKSMLAIGSEMQQFQVRSGAISFDCLFSTRDEPFVLSLTSRGLNPKFFKLEVRPGYLIKPYFDGFYGELAALLNSGANSGKKLFPKEFLKNINDTIPTTATVARNPVPSEIIRLRPDITEERDRRYFDTWIYWTEGSGKGPTAENRQKTKLVLGNDAHRYSIQMNASSRWSAEDLGRNWQGGRS